jgi:hypothetical protein
MCTTTPLYGMTPMAPLCRCSRFETEGLHETSARIYDKASLQIMADGHSAGSILDSPAVLRLCPHARAWQHPCLLAGPWRSLHR